MRTPVEASRCPIASARARALRRPRNVANQLDDASIDPACAGALARSWATEESDEPTSLTLSLRAALRGTGGTASVCVLDPSGSWVMHRLGVADVFRDMAPLPEGAHAERPN